MGAALSSLVFQPPQVTYVSTTKNLVWIESKGEAKIPCFHIDRKYNASLLMCDELIEFYCRCKVTLLFSHGNAEDIGMVYEWFCQLSRKLHVMLDIYWHIC